MGRKPLGLVTLKLGVPGLSMLETAPRGENTVTEFAVFLRKLNPACFNPVRLTSTILMSACTWDSKFSLLGSVIAVAEGLTNTVNSCGPAAFCCQIIREVVPAFLPLRST